MQAAVSPTAANYPECVFSTSLGLSKRKEAVLHRLELNGAFGHFILRFQRLFALYAIRDITHAIRVSSKFMNFRQRHITFLWRPHDVGLQLRAVLCSSGRFQVRLHGRRYPGVLADRRSGPYFATDFIARFLSVTEICAHHTRSFGRLL